MPYLMPSSAMLLIWLVLFDFGGAGEPAGGGAGRLSA